MRSTAIIMRAAIVSIAAAVDNVEAGHCTRSEREELVLVCDRVAAALRGEIDRSAAIDGDVISAVVER